MRPVETSRLHALTVLSCLPLTEVSGAACLSLVLASGECGFVRVS